MPAAIAWDGGIFRWASKHGKTFDCPRWNHEAEHNNLRVDTALQDRTSRVAMQAQAEITHTGEARWCNFDQYFHEVVSSSCAVVGVFVGYSVTQGKKGGDLCTSRGGQAECGVEWQSLPPLCRVDDLEARNAKLGRPGSSGRADREASPDDSSPEWSFVDWS